MASSLPRVTALLRHHYKARAFGIRISDKVHNSQNLSPNFTPTLLYKAMSTTKPTEPNPASPVRPAQDDSTKEKVPNTDGEKDTTVGNEKSEKTQRGKRKKNNRWEWAKKLKASKKGNPSGTVQEKKKNPRSGKWRSDVEGVEDKEPHAGSFANPIMQELFNVSVPTRDLSGEEKVETPLPKRKVALLLGFVGTKFSGMQINPEKRTIHAELELAIYNAGLISTHNFGFPKKYSWNNSARTDKGVHSCAQVCNIKLLLPTEDLNEIRDTINKKLNEDICVLDIKRTPKSFNAHTARDKVRYQYMLPSFVLQSREQIKKLFAKYVGVTSKERDNMHPLSEKERKTLHSEFVGYRSTDENKEDLNTALKRYVGTNSFHSYTSGKVAGVDSAKRYIISFDIQDVFIDDNGMEWITTNVVGQSFLLHQIRKMISMAVDIARGAVDKEVMETSFSDKKININTAPAQGLFLDMSYFDSYNRRNKAHESLDWYSEPEDPAVKRWKKFKEERIIHQIVNEEKNENNFIKYLFHQEGHIENKHYDEYDPEK